LNKYDVSKPLSIVREEAKICPNCGTSLNGLPMKGLVVASVLAAGILVLFSFFW
jgi:hypothetical protein